VERLKDKRTRVPTWQQLSDALTDIERHFTHVAYIWTLTYDPREVARRLLACVDLTPQEVGLEESQPETRGTFCHRATVEQEVRQ
jgi:hypothetical protein